MPTYEIPTPSLEEMQPFGPEEEFVTLPINKEIADELTVDGRVEVIFQGVVKEIDSGFSMDERYSMRVAVKKIEAYPENEFTELSKDDDD